MPEYDWSLIDGTAAPGESDAPDRDRTALLEWIANPARDSVSERWLILIGHGDP